MFQSQLNSVTFRITFRSRTTRANNLIRLSNRRTFTRGLLQDSGFDSFIASIRTDPGQIPQIQMERGHHDIMQDGGTRISGRNRSIGLAVELFPRSVGRTPALQDELRQIGHIYFFITPTIILPTENGERRISIDRTNRTEPNRNE